MPTCKDIAKTASALAGLLVGWGHPAAADGQIRHFETPAAFERDRDFNRIQRRSPAASANAATAQGNLVAISQEGRGNTIMLILDQTNTGTVTATSVLNGSLNLD
ncbi:MAG: hypothetical protein AAGC57_20555 [Pseudomonadota bacterium]